MQTRKRTKRNKEKNRLQNETTIFRRKRFRKESIRYKQLLRNYEYHSSKGSIKDIRDRIRKFPEAFGIKSFIPIKSEDLGPEYLNMIKDLLKVVTFFKLPQEPFNTIIKETCEKGTVRELYAAVAPIANKLLNIGRTFESTNPEWKGIIDFELSDYSNGQINIGFPSSFIYAIGFESSAMLEIAKSGHPLGVAGAKLIFLVNKACNLSIVDEDTFSFHTEYLDNYEEDDPEYYASTQEARDEWAEYLIEESRAITALGIIDRKTAHIPIETLIKGTYRTKAEKSLQTFIKNWIATINLGFDMQDFSRTDRFQEAYDASFEACVSYKWNSSPYENAISEVSSDGYYPCAGLETMLRLGSEECRKENLEGLIDLAERMAAIEKIWEKQTYVNSHGLLEFNYWYNGEKKKTIAKIIKYAERTNRIQID